MNELLFLTYPEKISLVLFFPGSNSNAPNYMVSHGHAFFLAMSIPSPIPIRLPTFGFSGSNRVTTFHRIVDPIYPRWVSRANSVELLSIPS